MILHIIAREDLGPGFHKEAFDLHHGGRHVIQIAAAIRIIDPVQSGGTVHDVLDVWVGTLLLKKEEFDQFHLEGISH